MIEASGDAHPCLDAQGTSYSGTGQHIADHQPWNSQAEIERHAFMLLPDKQTNPSATVRALNKAGIAASRALGNWHGATVECALDRVRSLEQR